MYPTIVPIAEIQLVIEIIRNGQISEKSSELAHALWVVQGYAQGVVFGKPEMLTGMTAADVLTDDTALVELEKLTADYFSPNIRPTTQISVPWQLLARWAINHLFKMIEERL